MAGTTTTAGFWELVRAQHGVVNRRQLLALGYGRHAIAHRVERGRLHPKARGVYAVGRPDLTWHGELMVAVLACGEDTLISHHTAAALLGVTDPRPGPIAVTVSHERGRSRPGIEVHRRTGLVAADRGRVDEIPVTSAARTLVDIAPRLSLPRLERAVNLADSLDLIDPERLRAECERLKGRPGVAKLRGLLDRRTFRATDSMLEQRFLAIVRRTPLPLPDTRRRAGGSASTSSGPASAWSSRPTACATTARRRSSIATACATRPTLPPGARRCASPTPRSSTRAKPSHGAFAPPRDGCPPRLPAVRQLHPSPPAPPPRPRSRGAGARCRPGRCAPPPGRARPPRRAPAPV